MLELCAAEAAGTRAGPLPVDQLRRSTGVRGLNSFSATTISVLDFLHSYYFVSLGILSMVGCRSLCSEEFEEHAVPLGFHPL